MKKSEQRALEAYPILFSEREALDDRMVIKRLAYQYGYEQAENDLRLLPEDIAVIYNLVLELKDFAKVLEVFNESR